MDKTALAKQLQELNAKRIGILERLVSPSRAAANAMKDAGMNATADPISQVIFELDALTDQYAELVSQEGFSKAFVELIQDLR